MTKVLTRNINTRWENKKFPPYQQFVSIYFVRNLVYLRSTYLLACGAFCGPSRDLQRTIYETILKGYLFVVDQQEADVMYSVINGTIESKELKALRRRRFWPFEYLINRLYLKETRESNKKFYEALSRFSHPSIKSVYHDLEYSKTEVEDCLNVILSLTYGNIQMMAEGFYDLLDSTLKRMIRESLFEIADFQGETGLFEPDQERWFPKIRLKKGNFLHILKS
jgi:hypothetical protein